MTAHVWTPAEIRAFGARMNGLTACEIVYGVKRSKGYALLRSGNVDFKVIRVPGTNRFIVPTSEVLRVLGLEAEP